MSDQPVTNEPVPMTPEPDNPGGVVQPTKPKTPEIIPQSAFDLALESWLGTYVRGTPVTEAAQAWAHLSSVLPNLKDFLEAELTKLKG